MNIGSDLLHWKSLWISREMSSLERDLQDGDDNGEDGSKPFLSTSSVPNTVLFHVH